MKKILLINGYRVGLPILPTGLGYIAQAVENAGFDYEVLDVNLHTNEEILQLVRGCCPQFIGLGTMTFEVEKNYQLLNLLHDAVPDAIIVLGGPHAIAAHKEIFLECPVVDIVILGEGEKSIVALLQGIPASKIPGALTRTMNSTAIPHELLSIDTLDFPKYHKFAIEKYGDVITLASSRGCVYKCSFCGAPKFLGKKWRAFTAEQIIEEFKYWYAKGYRQFYFSDSLFALNKKRVIDFCAFIIKSKYQDVVFTADGIRADHLTLEVLEYMKKAHFKALTIGVESVNEETLRFFEKGESFAQIDKAIGIADSLDFEITLYFIIGAPNESSEDALQSIRYPAKYKNIVHAIFSKLTPIKGTTYYDYALKHRLIADESVYYPQQEALGFNEPCKTSCNTVETIWTAVHHHMEKMIEFLFMRNQLKRRLGMWGVDIGVRRLNRLAQICLVPEIFNLLRAVKRMAKLMKLSH